MNNKLTQIEQAALKHYEDSFKGLHDCVMKKYPVDAWGKDIIKFAISKLEEPLTAELALKVLKDNGWEEKSIVTDGKLLVNNPKERIPQVGGWIWTGYLEPYKTLAKGPLSYVMVSQCDHEKFWVQHNDLKAPRYFKDRNKTWFWDKD